MAVLVSGAAGSLPFAGCTILVDLTLPAVLPGVANPGGFFTQPIPIPANPIFLGSQVFAQAMVVDGAAPGGLAMSAGLALTLGR